MCEEYDEERLPHTGSGAALTPKNPSTMSTYAVNVMQRSIRDFGSILSHPRQRIFQIPLPDLGVKLLAWVCFRRCMRTVSTDAMRQ